MVWKLNLDSTIIYDKTTYPHNCHFWAAFVTWKILKEHSSTQVSELNYQHVVYQDL